MPKYFINVKLTDKKEDPAFILGRVKKALRKAGASEKEVAEFRKEATSGNFRDLLTTCTKWVHCE